MEFVSYAHQDLSRKRIKKYARQYAGVDMAALIGADEDNFPFLIGGSQGDFSIWFWDVYNGMMEYTDEDAVRAYATALYLEEQAYPSFASLSEAERWAKDRNWPRKSRTSD